LNLGAKLGRKIHLESTQIQSFILFYKNKKIAKFWITPPD
jgi:hypothetical protein